jgi:protein involved in polysaccharide export with SLBB domain
VGAVLVVLACPAIAQSLANPSAADEPREPRLPVPVPLAGPVNPDRYRLGPGDVLQLALYGPISRQTLLVVAPEGTLYLPELGSIRVAGLTLGQARQMVTSRIKGALRGIGVEFQLLQPRTFRIYLTGELRLTGPHTANATSRLADVLSDTLLLTTSSRRRIEVRSLDGTHWLADLDRFRLTGMDGDDRPLADGDVVQVPVANQFLAAWGGVGRQGHYELGLADSLSTLLQLAGGLQRDAVPEHALLVRWNGSRRDSVWLSLRDSSAAGLAMPLQDGDELHVFTMPNYHESDRVRVDGRVAVTGSYPVRSGVTRLSDLLKSAGGILPDADSASVLLFRARPAATADIELDRLSKLSRSEMTSSEYATFQTRLAGLAPDFRVDLRKAAPGGVNDPLLTNGDSVVVSRVVRAVRVDGQVLRPGVVDLKAGAPWSYYVKECGGTTNRAARNQVRITRASSGQTLPARETDVPLAGDFLWVPERADNPAWPYIRDSILIMAQLATVAIAFRH